MCSFVTDSASNRRVSLFCFLCKESRQRNFTTQSPERPGTKEPHPSTPSHPSSDRQAGRVGNKEENPFCPPVLSSCPGKPGRLGRRLERKEELRFCAREASPCLARRREGTSSAGPFPEGSLARKAATIDSGQARRCGGHTGFTCQPPLCLLLSYCLVPCLPHWCSFTSVLILYLALQLRS